MMHVDSILLHREQVAHRLESCAGGTVPTFLHGDKSVFRTKAMLAKVDSQRLLVVWLSP